MNANKTEKEKNFISAVVYMHNNEKDAIDFLSFLNEQFDARFAQYELIVIDDRCSDNTMERIKEWAKNMVKPLTIIHMSLYQGLEEAMNAGLDCAIGDYVYEFDYAKTIWPAELIGKAYDMALQGNDIVAVCPTKQHGSSWLFYKLFNAHSNSAYQLRTDVFRLVSRRAINRVHAVSDKLPYRKAAYAASGLKMSNLLFEGSTSPQNEGRFDLAVDSLALYTDAGYKLSVGITGVMLFVALVELIYTVVVYIGGKPIEGWTTMMFVLTLGLLGLFAVQAMICKYLSLILCQTFRKPISLVEGIEKIQK